MLRSKEPPSLYYMDWGHFGETYFGLFGLSLSVMFLKQILFEAVSFVCFSFLSSVAVIADEDHASGRLSQYIKMALASADV